MTMNHHHTYYYTCNSKTRKLDKFFFYVGVFWMPINVLREGEGFVSGKMGLLKVGSFEIVRSQQDADFYSECK